MPRVKDRSKLLTLDQRREISRNNLAKARAAIFARTHCPSGHPFAGDNLRLRAGHRRCLICMREAQRKKRRNGNLTKPVVARVIEALQEGRSLTEIGGKKGNRYVGRKICSVERLKIFCSEHPQIGRRILKLAAVNAKANHARGNNERRLSAAPAMLRNNGYEGYSAIVDATRGVFEDHRNGTRSLMWLALSEGKLLPVDIKARVPGFAAQYRREIGTYYRGFGQVLSLDEQVFDDGEMTRGDTITRGFWE